MKFIGTPLGADNKTKTCNLIFISSAQEDGTFKKVRLVSYKLTSR
jgi:hypothetical protein